MNQIQKHCNRTLMMALFAGRLLLGAGGVGGAEVDSNATASLADLSLEALVNLKVTSVCRHEERLIDAAAAVFVLSNDDLRHSGATTVADALRLVPGLQVASIGSSEWAISARGFNQQFANKLLVMIDGRTVYSPLFSGVYCLGRWNQPLSENSQYEVQAYFDHTYRNDTLAEVTLNIADVAFQHNTNWAWHD